MGNGVDTMDCGLSSEYPHPPVQMGGHAGAEEKNRNRGGGQETTLKM